MQRQHPHLAGRPQRLRIGDQKSAANLVTLKQQGVLEKRFPATQHTATPSHHTPS